MNPSSLYRQPSTFIPQQVPQVAHRGLYYNLFFILGNVALVVMVLAWAGLFGYRFYLDQEIIRLQGKLTESAATALNGDRVREIEEIKALDMRLNLGKSLIESHLVIQPLFSLIDQLTLTNSVRFTNFKYEAKEGVFEVTFAGKAASFSSLAYQQDVLKNNPAVTNPTFSSFSLDEKTGSVSFNLSFTITPGTLLFKNTVDDTSVKTTEEVPAEALPKIVNGNETL